MVWSFRVNLGYHLLISWLWTSRYPKGMHPALLYMCIIVVDGSTIITHVQFTCNNQDALQDGRLLNLLTLCTKDNNYPTSFEWIHQKDQNTHQSSSLAAQAVLASNWEEIEWYTTASNHRIPMEYNMHGCLAAAASPSPSHPRTLAPSRLHPRTLALASSHPRTLALAPSHPRARRCNLEKGQGTLWRGGNRPLQVKCICKTGHCRST
jgi:hypothetical protein